MDWKDGKPVVYHAATAYDIHDLRDIDIDADAGIACVYFFQSGLEGPIKIGWCGIVRRIPTRLSDCQLGNPETISIRRLVAGNRMLERTLHKHFAPLRIRGEWFSPGPELLRLATPAN